MPGENQELALRLVVAALGGLAIGAEREWSAKTRGRHHDFAGVRTFALVGTAGGLSGLLAGGGQAELAAILLGGLVLLVIAAYVYAARHGDLDGTTEVAALLAAGAGLLAGLGQLALASGVFAGVALLLVEKGRIHAAIAALRSEELEAAFRFAVLALVVLPLLPEGPFGPDPGVRPRELWALVLLFSGLSFAGYVALRLAGPERGYALAGLFGGLISSTAVTLDFARQSRDRPEHGRALGLGLIAACTTLCVRVPLLASALSVPFALRAGRALILPLMVGLLLSLRELRRPAVAVATAKHGGPKGGGETVALPGPAAAAVAVESARTGPGSGRSPLGLAAAMKMTLLFLVVSFLVQWLGTSYGSAGLFGSAAVVSLTDMDALTYSLAKASQAATPLQLAVSAALVGVLVNTTFKLLLALVLGAGSFRAVAGGGLVALGLATAAGLWWVG